MLVFHYRMKFLRSLLGRLRAKRRSEAESHLVWEASPLSKKRLNELREVEKILGYSFRSPKLLDRALTHKSFVHETSGEGEEKSCHDYESLEFLGDSILGLLISEFLFRNYPTRPEGELSKIKSFLVSAGQLYLLSQKLGLGRFTRLSYGEEKTGGRNKKAILADLFESVTAAIYLDGGLEAARGFILSQFGSRFQKIAQEKLEFKDYKSSLQEQLHLMGYPEPRYRVVDEVGPDHNKQFVVEVRVKNRFLAKATGKSKKEAQQLAAQIAMEVLEESTAGHRSPVTSRR